MKKSEFWRVKKIFSGLLIVLSVCGLNGQNGTPEPYPQIRFGGGVGLSFGSGFFSGALSPSAIYQFDPQFALGLGLNGAYSSLKNRYTSTIVGASVIGLYNVIPEVQLSAELEEQYVTRNYEYDGGNFRDSYWYPALFVGAGFQSGNFTVGIKYDLLFDREKSIYADAYAPFVRIYF